MRAADHGQMYIPGVKLSTYGGRMFSHAGLSSQNAFPNHLKDSTVCLSVCLSLCLLSDASLNISTCCTCTPNAFEAILLQFTIVAGPTLWNSLPD